MGGVAGETGGLRFSSNENLGILAPSVRWCRKYPQHSIKLVWQYTTFRDLTDLRQVTNIRTLCEALNKPVIKTLLGEVNELLRLRYLTLPVVLVTSSRTHIFCPMKAKNLTQ